LKQELAVAVPLDITAAEPTSYDHDLGDGACDHKIVNADVVESNDFARRLAKARGEGAMELVESLLKLAKARGEGAKELVESLLKDPGIFGNVVDDQEQVG
jgi:hypothetical protein